MPTQAQLQAEFLGLANDDFFGEDITYVSAGVEKEIRAIVYRNKLNSISARFDGGTGGGRDSTHNMYDFEIRISSDAIYGITSVNIKEDTVKVPRSIGGVAVTARVMAIVGQDPATWKLGLSI